MRRRDFIKSLSLLSIVPFTRCKKEEGRRNFSKEAIVLFALAETLFQKGYVSIKEIDKETFLKEMDDFLQGLSSDTRTGMKWMIRFFEYSPIIYFHSTRSFSSLSLEERKRFIKRLANCRFRWNRVMLFSLKTIPTIYYFSDPDIKKELGINYKV